MTTLMMPRSIQSLPVDPVRKIPVPWFVAWIDGKPEFRMADGDKLHLAIRERRRWVCGQRLDNRVTFVIGPMCVVNRVTAEPPCHPACAEYSVQACPFLSRPNMVRREGGLPAHGQETGVMIRRNPGVTCLWTGKSPGARPFREGSGILFSLFPPLSLSWWAEGRKATKAEVDASVESGLPILREIAGSQSPEALASLERMVCQAQSLFDQVA